MGEPKVTTDWNEFLSTLKAEGGSTDMQTSASGRYPWSYHFCRGQNEQMNAVVVYAHRPYPKPVLVSPPRDWSTEERIRADYEALKEHGGFFNDTARCLAADRSGS